MLLIELSMSPLDKGASVSRQVARSLDIIDRSGLKYRVGPMGTCIEGEWDEVMTVVKKCYLKMRTDCSRITFSLKGDWRSGREKRLDRKVAKVEKLLKRKLSR